MQLPLSYCVSMLNSQSWYEGGIFPNASDNTVLNPVLPVLHLILVDMEGVVATGSIYDQKGKQTIKTIFLSLYFAKACFAIALTFRVPQSHKVTKPQSRFLLNHSTDLDLRFAGRVRRVLKYTYQNIKCSSQAKYLAILSYGTQNQHS